MIISTKFLYFRYLNICLLELLEKNLNHLQKDINQYSFGITEPWMCRKSKKFSRTCIEKSCDIFRKVGKSNRGL